MHPFIPFTYSCFFGRSKNPLVWTGTISSMLSPSAMAPSLVLPTEYGRILSHSDSLFWRSTSSVSWTGTSVSALGPSAAAPQASTVYAPPLQPGASLSSLSATQPIGMQSGLTADTPVVKKVSGVSCFLSSLITKYLTPLGVPFLHHPLKLVTASLALAMQ